MSLAARTSAWSARNTTTDALAPSAVSARTCGAILPAVSCRESRFTGPSEVLPTWALLEGTRTTTGRRRTVKTVRNQRVRVFISEPPRLREQAVSQEPSHSAAAQADCFSGRAECLQGFPRGRRAAKGLPQSVHTNCRLTAATQHCRPSNHPPSAPAMARLL